MKNALALALLTVSASTLAQTSVPDFYQVKEVYDLVHVTDDGAFACTLASLKYWADVMIQQMGQGTADVQPIYRCADTQRNDVKARLPGAIQALAGKTESIKALKLYYLKWDAFTASFIPTHGDTQDTARSRQNASEAAANEAKASLALEMKLGD